jgi:hypothetical protein
LVVYITAWTSDQEFQDFAGTLEKSGPDGLARALEDEGRVERDPETQECAGDLVRQKPRMTGGTYGEQKWFLASVSDAGPTRYNPADGRDQPAARSASLGVLPYVLPR